MVSLRSTLSIVFDVILISHCYAQTNGLPSDWIETMPPSEQISHGSSLACANYSAREWKVSLTPRGVQVIDSSEEKVADALPPNFVKTRQMRGHATTMKTADGWLVGFDAGEFGGGLWWSSENGETTKLLSEENVHALIPREDVVLVLTGLDHMGSNVGAISAYRPSSRTTSRSLTSIAELDSAPDAAAITENGDLIVVTQGSVLNFGKNNHVETLFHYPAMAALYPNSLVVMKDGRLFTGMRFYALELRPDKPHSYSAKWFVPSECRKAHVKNYDCVCDA